MNSISGAQQKKNHPKAASQVRMSHRWNQSRAGTPKTGNAASLFLPPRATTDSARNGVLAFDFTRDGKYDPDDVKNASSRMKAVSGAFQFGS